MDTTVVPHRITLRSGHRGLVRAVRPDDGPSLAEAYDQLSQTSVRAAARGEFIALPAVLRGWLDLSEKIIATLLVPVRAFCDTSREAASTATAPGRPEDPATTSQKLPRSNS